MSNCGDVCFGEQKKIVEVREDGGPNNINKRSSSINICPIKLEYLKAETFNIRFFLFF